MKRALFALLLLAGCGEGHELVGTARASLVADHTVARWEADEVTGSPMTLDDAALLSLGEQGTHEPSLRLSSLDGNGRAFWLGTGHADFLTPDRLLNLGWNIRGSGGAVDTTEHAWSLQFEHRYDRPAPAHDLAEFHVHYYGANGGPYKRPLSVAVDLETHLAQVALAGDVLLLDEAGGINLRTYYSSGTFAYRDVRLIAPASLRIGGKVGFYDAAPAPKPTVSGSDAATICHSLTDALESLGLVTDATTP